MQDFLTVFLNICLILSGLTLAILFGLFVLGTFLYFKEGYHHPHPRYGKETPSARLKK